MREALPNVAVDERVSTETQASNGQTPHDELATGEIARFEQLMKEMRAGSQQAATEIVETYGPAIRSVVKARLAHILRPMFDSEDFVQSAWKSLLAMQPEKVDAIRHPNQLIALLITIASRKTIEQYRRGRAKACNVTRRRPLDDPEVLAELARVAGVNTPSAICIAREKQDRYRQRWEELVNGQPPRNQRIVNLRLGGQPFSAIAAAEDVSERHARRVVHQLLRRLSDTERAA